VKTEEVWTDEVVVTGEVELQTDEVERVEVLGTVSVV
jgi:hypothetical protein